MKKRKKAPIPWRQDQQYLRKLINFMLSKLIDNNWHFLRLNPNYVVTSQNMCVKWQIWENRVCKEMLWSKSSLRELSFIPTVSVSLAALITLYMPIITLGSCNYRKCIVIILLLTTAFLFFILWLKYHLLQAQERYWQKPRAISINEIYLIYKKILL